MLACKSGVDVNTRREVAQSQPPCLQSQHEESACVPKRKFQRQLMRAGERSEQHQHQQITTNNPTPSRPNSLVHHKWASKDRTPPWPSKRATRAQAHQARRQSCPCSKAFAQNWTSTTTAESALLKLLETLLRRLRKCNESKFLLILRLQKLTPIPASSHSNGKPIFKKHHQVAKNQHPTQKQKKTNRYHQPAHPLPTPLPSNHLLQRTLLQNHQLLLRAHLPRPAKPQRPPLPAPNLRRAPGVHRSGFVRTLPHHRLFTVL
jgi:hypothetical protein